METNFYVVIHYKVQSANCRMHFMNATLDEVLDAVHNLVIDRVDVYDYPYSIKIERR